MNNMHQINLSNIYISQIRRFQTNQACVNAKLDIYVLTQTHATVNNDQPIATTRYTINNHLEFNKIISQIQGNIIYKRV